ncbi:MULTISPECIES: pyridoxine/pyridoxamine 5'-phosphate oxidase [Arthrobacter]|uniref:Pyridoxamine 5'-phosphate oxidase n=1 Tax=Arthrobacter psychrochitiniphilus TaxID=291045 RepID=A0A2V3DSH3_9MICC|nr:MULTISPECIES: pyridoxal 5'-phosphate synthase [Arthrobacter]NYG17895.1 pyridoxamine 5'-phosphate oxidase [Arthrobacter psychrochitiniphilus]PXA65084.1 pyridoxamine 5'-phosphate oxidase [Arthrobacter psychrochitiniphilus]
MQTRGDGFGAVPPTVGQEPGFAVASAPDLPHELFLRWRQDAIHAGLTEAYAAILSTVDADGMPDARVLTVKDVNGDCGFRIATGDDSTKGAQLLANPKCALTFYWSTLNRVVRIRGTAHRATAAESAADFLTRHPQTRVNALAAPQSSTFATDAAREELIKQAQAAMELDPEIVSPQWAAWTVVPKSVEFWQGDPHRNHQRLRYLRTDSAWEKQRLWP